MVEQQQGSEEDALEATEQDDAGPMMLPQRDTWSKKVEFLLAVIGFAVDLGNVWRFPYICYQNGGGAFLIPYCIMLVFGGMPLFFMELALGQFHRSGCLTIWKRICPALKGVGYAICLLDVYMGMYYNTIIGWAVYYLVASFRSELPWTSCNNPWNTPNCTPIVYRGQVNNSVSPATEFFERSVLEQQKSDGLDRMGPIKWSLALCVLAVFLLVYFSLWKGVKSTGKAVWVTALAPYVVLFILLIRGVTLPGAALGIHYYLTPQWHKLLNTKVWIDAASQIFFSLGPGFGTLLALSSYNKFHNNCYRDALVTSSINCLTSFLAGFVIFSVLGYMAHVQGKKVDEVGLEGPGLVFIVYPEAIATMTGSVFWSIIFFLMLITLGLDSTFGGLEAMITALCDEYPRLLGRNRELFVAGLLICIYICSLPTCTYSQNNTKQWSFEPDEEGLAPDDSIRRLRSRNIPLQNPRPTVEARSHRAAADVASQGSRGSSSHDEPQLSHGRNSTSERDRGSVAASRKSRQSSKSMRLQATLENLEATIRHNQQLRELQREAEEARREGEARRRKEEELREQYELERVRRELRRASASGSKGGVYLVNLLNVYGPGLAILFVVFVEAAGVCWVYGVERFSADIELMLGHKPGIFWRLCWAYISPIFLLVIFVASLLSYEEMLEGDYVYPKWSINLGWALTASSLSCIPIYIVYKFSITKGSCWERVVRIMKPEEYYCETRVISANYGTAGTHV